MDFVAVVLEEDWSGPAADDHLEDLRAKPFLQVASVPAIAFPIKLGFPIEGKTYVCDSRHRTL